MAAMSAADNSGEPAALYSEENGCATVTFNRPAQLNAMSAELVTALHAALDQAEASSSVKQVVFRANGKAFSAGLDLSAIDTETDGDVMLRLVRIEQLLQRVRHASVATVACVHGACYGAAADLVLACRTRIASGDAKFLMPGMRFGIILGTRRLRDTLGEQAAYQLLDRRTPFTVPQALATGFITESAGAEDWPKVVGRALQNISAFSGSAYALRVASLTPDTREADMHALVTSIAAGSIKERLRNYVESVKAERAQRSAR
jgi:enoyl-CoA hydratase/carnithine racemase